MPAWSALTTQVPAFKNARVVPLVPLTLHTSLVLGTVKTTAPPGAVALRVAATPTVPVLGADQVIDCAVFAAVVVTAVL